ncbi:unnamed protein product [Rotaria sp. Silwood1]|nr:unnamed protein product [Rotaria sp. Silwood1]CAF1145468.1 unnamed protein product [Rotaria sp. Silwood1]CAF4611035.1 unnamed protein product [Rotaria sp. Silwood1]
MASVYILLFILISNKLLFIHSFAIVHDDQYQNQLENLQQDAIEQLITNYMATPEHSSFNENDLESLLKPTVQRRFCCMSPLSGRKRFIRDLARKQ